MADYTQTKEGIGAVYKENQTESVWRGLEPLITPEQVRERHLWGLPMVSALVNPFTKKPYILKDELIKDMIIQAVALAEAEAKIDIFPKTYGEKEPFDRPAYESYGYMTVRHKPVQSIESLLLMPATQQAIFEVPLEWIDVGLLHQGQINLIPMTIAMKTGTVVPLTSAPGGAAFLSVFGNKHWLPSFFQVSYTCGFKEGALPVLVNQYIGTITAMEILSMLGATYARTVSGSLSLDGVSQSISTPGPNVFQSRLQDLADKRKWLIGRLQAQLGMKIVFGNV